MDQKRNSNYFSEGEFSVKAAIRINYYWVSALHSNLDFIEMLILCVSVCVCIKRKNFICAFFIKLAYL